MPFYAFINHSFSLGILPVSVGVDHYIVSHDYNSSTYNATVPTMCSHLGVVIRCSQINRHEADGHGLPEIRQLQTHGLKIGRNREHIFILRKLIHVSLFITRWPYMYLQLSLMYTYLTCRRARILHDEHEYFTKSTNISRRARILHDEHVLHHNSLLIRCNRSLVHRVDSIIIQHQSEYNWLLF